MSAGTEFEILPPELRGALQTRASFPAVAPESVLGTVQVADEAGFAYLDGDIDFGAVGKNEIFQNIKYIVLTEYFSVPLDREFGMDYSMVDKPMAIAEAILSQEVAMKIALYEPRAQFREIDYVRDEIIGKLSPSIVVVLLTTNELPKSMPSATAADLAGVPGGATVIEEIDLPGFYETLIALARTPGPQGPEGPKGKAATIEVGETTTGEAGTDAEVVNVGNEHEAVFDFVIPKGDKGDQGTGVNIVGTVPDSGDLPPTGEAGDIWITADTGHGWAWDGTQWVDVGPIQGPPGPAATIAVGTTTTGAPGSAADVDNVGTSSHAVFNFAIPQGIKGDQGLQGLTGPPNVLTVSETITASPGEDAEVTIAGTSPSQSLAFKIPTGNNAFTITTANFVVPIVGATVVVTLEDASWVVIGQMVVVQTSGGSPEEALSFRVTAKAGDQVTLLNEGIGKANEVPFHSWSHLDNGTDVIPLATTTRTGLAPKLSGVANTFLNGAGAYTSVPGIATMPAGSVIQTVIHEYTAYDASSSVIPFDNSPPQIGEGKQMFAVPFTPLFANSRIHLVFHGNFFGANYFTVCALFRDAVANALTANGVGLSTTLYAQLSLDHYDPAPGSLNQIIYQIRFGPHAAGTVYTNGASGIPNFGGVQKCVLTIQEIKQ